MRLSVLGLGHVGLSLSACFASKRHKVIGVDVDENKVAMINAGRSPIYEPGLEDLLMKTIRNGSLRCVTEFEEAVLGSDITFISVGTPALRNGNVDLRQVKVAARDIGRALKEKNGCHLVVVSSTVPPGTTESLVQPIIKKYSEKAFGRDFGLCMNPEFLREGNTIHDFFHPHLIVIGECDKQSGDKLEDLYKTFLEDRYRLMRVNPPTAELTNMQTTHF